MARACVGKVVDAGIGAGVTVGLVLDVGAADGAGAVVGAGANVDAGGKVASVVAWVTAGTEIAEEPQAATSSTNATASPATNNELRPIPFRYFRI